MLKGLRQIKGGFKAIASGVFSSVRSLLNFDNALLFFEGRNWDLSFGPIYGEAGTTKTITVSPQCLFRGEKVLATDTAEKPGQGTRIMSVIIGQRHQRPVGCGVLTLFFANGTIGNGIEWDICRPDRSILVTVNFIESCTFDMDVFGRAVI